MSHSSKHNHGEEKRDDAAVEKYSRKKRRLEAGPESADEAGEGEGDGALSGAESVHLSEDIAELTIRGGDWRVERIGSVQIANSITLQELEKLATEGRLSRFRQLRSVICNRDGSRKVFEEEKATRSRTGISR